MNAGAKSNFYSGEKKFWALYSLLAYAAVPRSEFTKTSNQSITTLKPPDNTRYGLSPCWGSWIYRSCQSTMRGSLKASCADCNWFISSESFGFVPEDSFISEVPPILVAWQHSDGALNGAASSPVGFNAVTSPWFSCNENLKQFRLFLTSYGWISPHVWGCFICIVLFLNLTWSLVFD